MNNQRPISDIEAMLINEHRSIERAISVREKAIKQLEAKVSERPGNLLRKRPRRYSLEYIFPPGTANAQLATQPQEQSFFVDGGTIFHARTVETHVRVVGVASVAGAPGQTAQITVPWGTGNIAGVFRNDFFDFFWRIRDNGSDREWQNVKQPSAFLASGQLTPAILPIPARIEGGSEVAMEVDPFYNSGSVVGLLTSVNQIIVHVSFAGHEVRE